MVETLLLRPFLGPPGAVLLRPPFHPERRNSPCDAPCGAPVKKNWGDSPARPARIGRFQTFFQARFPRHPSERLPHVFSLAAGRPCSMDRRSLDRQDLCGLALERRTFGSVPASRNATTTASRKAACCLDRPALESALQFVRRTSRGARPDGVRGRSLEGGRESGGPSVEGEAVLHAMG